MALTKETVNLNMNDWLNTETSETLKEKLDQKQNNLNVAREKFAFAMTQFKEANEKLLNYKANGTDFYSKLMEISNNTKIVDVELNVTNKKIIATTVPLIASVSNGGRYAVGAFKIEFSPATNQVKFFNLNEQDRHTSYWGEMCHHPHVSNNGNPCLGNTSESIVYLSAEREYQALFDMLIAFLEQANLDDCAGRFAMNWDRVLPNGDIEQGCGDAPSSAFVYGNTWEEDSFERVRECYHCEESFNESDMRQVEGRWLCRCCCDDYVVTCESCGYEFYDPQEENRITIGDTTHIYCDPCYSEQTMQCDECDEYIYVEDIEEYNDINICCSCKKKLEENKEVEKELEEEVEEELFPVTPNNIPVNTVSTNDTSENTQVCPRCNQNKVLDYVTFDGELVCSDCGAKLL